MTISHLLTFSGADSDPANVGDWFAGAPAAALMALPGVETLDLYAPEPSDDPYLNDGTGPVLTVQTGFESTDALEAGLEAAAARIAFGDFAGTPAAGCKIAHDAMEVKFFPVAGESAPSPLTATLSYVVRYHRPADDEVYFVDYYCTHHPPVLGKFPRIRNVICYLPIAWRDPTQMAQADYLLGNEVVFDSVDDLNEALRSEVRHELRADYKTFPRHGLNTHYAMHRRRLLG